MMTEQEVAEIALEEVLNALPDTTPAMEPLTRSEYHNGDWDHPFHFIRTGDAEGTVSMGAVYLGEDKIGDYSESASTIDEWYCITIDWTSSYSSPTITKGWYASIPSTSATKRVYPILHFSDTSDAETCTELFSTDIHCDAPNIPDGVNQNDMLYWDVSDGAWKLVTGSTTPYKVLQIDADGDLIFDWPRFNTAAP